jgi:very-short-patch-repair endonuclease
MRDDAGVDEAQSVRQPLKLLADAAGGSRGIVTTTAASALGISRKRLQRLVTKGALIREAHGVYRLVGSEVGLAERALVATTHTSGVISHQTAAQLWGYRGAGFEGEAIHVTVRHGCHPCRRPGMIVHLTRRTLEGLTTRRAGVEVTRPLRTMLDIAGEALDDKQLQGFLDYCVAEHLLSIRSLERYVSSTGRGIKGLARLRRVVERLCEVDSVAEARLVDLLVTAGVERPETQYSIRLGGRFLGRVDLAWPDRRVALELDGYRYHSDSRTFVNDRERGNRIVASGWILLRTTPASVHEAPHLVVSDLKAVLGRSSTVA